MRVHIELLGRDGTTVREATIESPLISIGGRESDDFVVPTLYYGAVQILTRGRELAVQVRGQAPLRVTEATVLRIGEFSGIGEVSVRVTPYPPPLVSAGGGCPRCGGALRDVARGGAYRSVARRERECQQCRAAILDLEGAETAIGAFADASRFDWFHVGSQLRCPSCGALMSRAHFSTTHGEAEVERCEQCKLVFLEPEDRRRLRGQESPGGDASSGGRG